MKSSTSQYYNTGSKEYRERRKRNLFFLLECELCGDANQFLNLKDYWASIPLKEVRKCTLICIFLTYRQNSVLHMRTVILETSSYS